MLGWLTEFKGFSASGRLSGAWFTSYVLGWVDNGKTIFSIMKNQEMPFGQENGSWMRSTSGI
jgi:hypothetical protein